MTLKTQITAIIFIFIFSKLHATDHPLVLLQTFGSTKDTGRIIAGNTERGVTLQLAEYINDALNESQDGIEALIINPAGKNKSSIIETFNKVNQLPRAVVFNLTASQSSSPKPCCCFFYRCYNPLTDQIKRPAAPLTPIPLEDVYLTSFNLSKNLAKNLTTNLVSQNHCNFDIKKSVGIPLSNVRGIRHPVVNIEIQIDQMSQITEIGTFLANSIKKMLTA